MTRFQSAEQTFLFPTTLEDTEAARALRRSPQTVSPTYRLAYADPDFLLRDDLGLVRLELELLKPELALQDRDINSSVVVFGSARIRAPKPRHGETHEHAGRPAQSALEDKSRYYQQAREFARIVSTQQ